MSDKLITQEQALFTDEQRRLIKDVLMKDGSDQEVAFFFQVAERLKLDPFKRQIHAMKRWDNNLRREVIVFMVSIEGLRSIASRCKTSDGQDAYAGSSKPRFTYDKDGHLESAEVTVYRMVQGHPREFTAEVFYSECVQNRNVYQGSGNNKQKVGEEPNSFWLKRPKGQLAKCSEAQALRKAFPEETGGVDVEEEFNQEEDGHRTERPTNHAPKPEAEGMTPMVDAELVPQDTAPPRHWSDLLIENAYNLVKFETGEWAGKALWEVAKDKADYQKAFESVPRDDSAIRHALDARYYMNLKKRLADKGYDEPAGEAALREAGFLNADEGLHAVPGELLLDLGAAIKDLPDTKK
jgi:phage recombination protein Bet